MSRGRKARWAVDLADPDRRDAMVASGRRLSAAHPSTPEKVQRQCATRRERHWLPVGYEQLNAELRAKCIPAPERRAIIFAQAAADERKRLAALSPFERQQRRLAAGAQLIDAQPLRRADPAFTLGGVASGQL